MAPRGLPADFLNGIRRNPRIGADAVEDFDFMTTMIEMMTALLDFLFQWLGMALAETGRAAMDNSIR